MGEEERKAAYNRVVEEAYNKGNLDVLDEVYASDYVYHNPPSPDIVGLEAYKQHNADIRSAFPDLQLTLDDSIIEVDRSAFRFTFRGTHTGQSPAMPVPPTGKQVTMISCLIAHWVDGKIVEGWDYLDSLGFILQLGFNVVPPQG